MSEQFNKAECRRPELAQDVATKFLSELDGNQSVAVNNAKAAIRDCAPTLAMDQAKKTPKFKNVQEFFAYYESHSEEEMTNKAVLFQNTSARILAEDVAKYAKTHDTKHKIPENIPVERLTDILRPRFE